MTKIFEKSNGCQAFYSVILFRNLAVRYQYNFVIEIASSIWFRFGFSHFLRYFSEYFKTRSNTGLYRKSKLESICSAALRPRF